MKYQTIKVSLGNRSNSNCFCAAPIGEVMGWFSSSGTDTTEDLNEAYQKAAEYNDRRTCGCRVEVRELI